MYLGYQGRVGLSVDGDVRDNDLGLSELATSSIVEAVSVSVETTTSQSSSTLVIK
jgi:hypothetical protein